MSPDPELDLAQLQALARQFPNVDRAVARIARLSAERTLPKPTVHVISDVHGEYAKLRHVINNASGTLRPLVEQLFTGKLNPAEMQELLALIFYPGESLDRLAPGLRDPDERRAFCLRVLPRLLAAIKASARRTSLAHAKELLPAEYSDVFQELLYEPLINDGAHFNAVVDQLVRFDRALHVIRLAARVLRNLAVDELVIAGDMWDRGARGDLVMKYLLAQPNVAIVWGNHDAAWLGAALGHEALIAHVLRISARYRRFSQLEEGYGITLQPLEHLVRAVYATDPAACYPVKGSGLREPVLMARMQKAAAVMQYKLEGQVIARNPQFALDNRRLLHRMDLKAGTVVIDGKTRTLRDTHFPTIDPADPYALSAEESACMARLKQSFLGSPVMWEHMQFLVGHGSMVTTRDDHVIFHGCVPVDESGEFLPLEIDGTPYRGRDMFLAIERSVLRAMDHPTDADRDLLWYLWCGARSPLFGKDRIATFEIDLVAEAETHAETKNPYFNLIHDVAFCDKVLAEFGADPARGLIVNGHVPVKIDKGESPLKRSGKAITIDGAFSEAYGDHGYTLLLEPARTALAKHHHFESVEAAVRDGIDIIPQVTEVRAWQPARRVGDTERGRRIDAEVALLKRLVVAYKSNRLRQS
jgi:fructose-1,6-bisphosphatase-3